MSLKAADLDLRELLHFDAEGGVIRFANDRALIFDAVALGILRRELIDAVGEAGARAILTRLGYAHGRRTAESIRAALPWESDDEWKRAGGRLHMLQGHVVVDPRVPRRGPGERAPFAEAVWHDSYEAEQHLLHAGRSEHPVCWTLTGFATGYLSFVQGREVYFLEERCRGAGDAVCHVVGRFREEWGDRIHPHLSFYDKATIDSALTGLAAELKRVERRLRARRKELGVEADAHPSGIIGRSKPMRDTIDLAIRVAKVDSTVLISGESGAGKERIARLIHDESARTAGPFVAINCAAMPESMLESELFGHARGAFTGATGDRPGLFESAARGTLLLDEIGEIPPATQVKLLRVLQERIVRRLGENKERTIDVRVLAATNRTLREEVAAGRFREDLYYRLRVVEIEVPPLRKRREDIAPLANAFLAAIAERSSRPVTGFTAKAMASLLRHDWPGNVRELQNAVERGVVLARGTLIDTKDLFEEPTPSSRRSASESRTLAEVERAHIERVLASCGGNRTRAAKELGIGSATLFRKLRRFRNRR